MVISMSHHNFAGHLYIQGDIDTYVYFWFFATNPRNHQFSLVGDPE